MAFPPHVQMALKMLPHLIDAAKEGRSVDYDDLAKAVGAQSKTFSKPLAFIRDDICARHRLPPLTAIVVNKGADKPTNSFAPPALETLSPTEYEALKQSSISEVYSYPKWDQALTGLKNLYCLN